MIWRKKIIFFHRHLKLVSFSNSSLPFHSEPKKFNFNQKTFGWLFLHMYYFFPIPIRAAHKAIRNQLSSRVSFQLPLHSANHFSTGTTVALLRVQVFYPFPLIPSTIARIPSIITFEMMCPQVAGNQRWIRTWNIELFKIFNLFFNTRRIHGTVSSKSYVRVFRNWKLLIVNPELGFDFLIFFTLRDILTAWKLVCATNQRCEWCKSRFSPWLNANQFAETLIFSIFLMCFPQLRFQRIKDPIVASFSDMEPLADEEFHYFRLSVHIWGCVISVSLRRHNTECV